MNFTVESALEGIYKILATVFRPQRINPSGAETRIFRENQNTVAVDTLAPSVTRTSAATVLIVWNKKSPYVFLVNVNDFIYYM